MQLGAYAVVRFANDVRDERLNLGVLVWHPHDGFCFRYSSSLERVKAIDPDIRLKTLQDTIKGIRDRSSVRDAPKELFNSLSNEFREGLQVSGIYPARLSSLDATADRLYSLLVEYPTDEKPEVINFQLRLASSIQEIVPEIDPVDGSFENIGVKNLGGVMVDVGMRSRTGNLNLLWRGVSLRTMAKEDQLARAKGAVADITRVSAVSAYKGMHKIVMLERPKIPQPSVLKDCRSWIESVGAEAIDVQNASEIASAVKSRLRAA